MILSRTPFRVSFFGGGSDLPSWFRKNTGEVLSTTIDKYCYITARFLPPFFANKFRIVYSKIEEVNSIDSINHPVVKAFLNEYAVNKGVEIHHFSDLPARSGIGSSSSFTVGLINSLSALYQENISKLELANKAIHIEQDILKENVGCQDQIAVSFGGLNNIYFEKNGSYIVNQIKIADDRRNDFENNLLLFFTGITRFSSNIQEKQIKNIKINKSKLTAMQSMVQDGINILSNKKHSLDDFGYLLNESWKIKESLADGISNQTIHNFYSEVLNEGALGGKLLGAVGGGFMIFYVNPRRQKTVIETATTMGMLHIPFKFENSGSKIIYND